MNSNAHIAGGAVASTTRVNCFGFLLVGGRRGVLHRAMLSVLMNLVSSFSVFHLPLCSRFHLFSIPSFFVLTAYLFYHIWQFVDAGGLYFYLSSILMNSMSVYYRVSFVYSIYTFYFVSVVNILGAVHCNLLYLGPLH